jgi:hypothetical protein
MGDRDRPAWEDERPGPHVWRTLAYRRVEPVDGKLAIEWDPGED